MFQESRKSRASRKHGVVMWGGTGEWGSFLRVALGSPPEKGKSLNWEEKREIYPTFYPPKLELAAAEVGGL